MTQGSRPERVGEQVRQALSEILLREAHDPGIGLITLTHVKVSPDLQVVRVFYTLIGDDKARRETARALERATPFLRRQLAGQVRLRRVPELHFQFDESIENQDRIERILLELQAERDARAAELAGGETPGAEPESEPGPENEGPGTGNGS